MPARQAEMVTACNRFDHADLQKLSPDEIRSQMARLDQVLDETIGMRPTFMRPPYYSISPEVLKVLEEMQYHVVHSDIDTNDWKYNRIRNRGKALHLLKSGLQKGGSIVLMHDIHNTTVNWLVPKAVPFLRESGKRCKSTALPVARTKNADTGVSRDGGGVSRGTPGEVVSPELRIRSRNDDIAGCQPPRRAGYVLLHGCGRRLLLEDFYRVVHFIFPIAPAQPRTGYRLLLVSR